MCLVPSIFAPCIYLQVRAGGRAPGVLAPVVVGVDAAERELAAGAARRVAVEPEGEDGLGHEALVQRVLERRPRAAHRNLREGQALQGFLHETCWPQPWHMQCCICILCRVASHIRPMSCYHWAWRRNNAAAPVSGPLYQACRPRGSRLHVAEQPPGASTRVHHRHPWSAAGRTMMPSNFAAMKASPAAQRQRQHAAHTSQARTATVTPSHLPRHLFKALASSTTTHILVDEEEVPHQAPGWPQQRPGPRCAASPATACPC